jgi:hypothetical protein
MSWTQHERALLALDFQNYGVPAGLLAQPWRALLASDGSPRRGHHCQGARRRETPSFPDHPRRGGLADPGSKACSPAYALNV